MIFLQLLASLALLLLTSLGPGLFLLRRLRWRPLEAVCGAVALSLLWQYLAAFALYLSEASPSWAVLPTALAGLATWRSLGQFRSCWRERETRAALLAYLALVGWLLLLLLVIRNYAGARWSGDWFEHYARTLFFVEHQPLGTVFLDLYTLPARPPMMNLLAAPIFWQLEPRFELFQGVFAALNALVLLPCALLARACFPRRRHRAWLIAGVLALNPMFVQNGTYTWTKAFAAFYGLTALAFYLSAWRRTDPTRMVAAFVCLATAMLIHYSAAVLVLFLAGHYLCVLFRRRPARWREIGAATALGTLVFGTWLAWSLQAYGVRETFASNTAVTASRAYSPTGNLVKTARNIYHTLVPFPLRGRYEEDPGYFPKEPPRGLAYWRDWFFALYQTEFPAMLGLGGLIPLCGLWLAGRSGRAGPTRLPGRRFWIWFFVIETLLGIAVLGEYDFLGVAQICLQPVALLALTYAAVGLVSLPRGLQAVALAGLLLDAVLGILLHVHLLNRDFGFSFREGRIFATDGFDLGRVAMLNGFTKFAHNLSFLGDHAAGAALVLQVGLAALALGIVVALWRLGAGSMVPRAPALWNERDAGASGGKGDG